MSPQKQFRLRKQDIKRKRLIPGMGSCFATDHITVQGSTVGYMYREPPDNELDSGWRFFSGRESQEYVDDPANTSIYDVNTIANYDPAIIPYLGSPEGTQLDRVPDTSTFRVVRSTNDATAELSGKRIESDLIMTPVPALVAVLLAKEKEKGTRLTREEVEAIADQAESIAMPQDARKKIDEARGYDDIDPERAWEEWLSIREELL